jgi:hypothetical protein
VPDGNGRCRQTFSDRRNQRLAFHRSILDSREGGDFRRLPPDNDPQGERDFGAFEHNGDRIFWKIDYYAHDMEHGSEDASDPRQTVRVLTIMLASEY